ncbi:hypothetical protein FVA81_01010 (plasmid) [Rhizobium sp. WL3]|uniref:hypothetical protein n=1 Tax=Rhizobium sp. WL3 TaxID=2603277 RepID=UPI0011C1F578|nr:hypothetical protein [Rhizobium sp. WL3]QEE43260.1 hypothetical protein FVA81_01010 [Rhizobium sp. WL3]
MKIPIPVAYFSVALAAIVMITARPSGPFVLVVTAPSAEAAGNMAVLDRADGAFVWASTVPWISVAYSQAPDFPERLLDAGALLVINHDLALGCLQGMNT